MEGILFIIGVLVLLWIITPFALLRLHSRVRRLEKLMQAEKTVLHSSSVAKNATTIPITSHKTPTPPDQAQPFLLEKFASWFKEDWLLKMGGLLLLIGFGWLTTYAFMNNWIGPMGRIGFGIILGTIILIIGTWRIRTYVHQGGIFIIIGSTAILITVFAARQFYDFFTPWTALGIMFLSCLYVAVVSIRFNDRTLSVASVALAGIAPLLTNPPHPSPTPLFAYLLVVVLGSVWVVAVTDHRETTSAALLVVSLYSIPYVFGHEPANTLLLFAYVFAALFFVTNTMGILKLKEKNIIPDSLTAAGNGIFLLTWIVTKAPEDWKSLIITGWMLAFVTVAFAAFKVLKKREPFYVYAGVGITMLAAATATELSGSALTIALTIEVGMISYIAHVLLKENAISDRLCLLFFIPGILSISSIQSRAWSSGVFNNDFFVLCIFAVTLLALGTFYAVKRDKPQGTIRHTTSALLIVGSLYGFRLLWLSLHAGLYSSALATMASLFIYTLVGLAAYFFGRVHDQKGLGRYGGAVLGCVIARLLVVDVWNMPMASRFVTFFVIGILLMSTAFFARKKTHSSKQS